MQVPAINQFNLNAMNQNKSLFIFLTILLATASLFIPYWFNVYFLALICCVAFDISSKLKLIIHFTSYYAVSVTYCIYAVMNGSSSLVQMISGVFQGVSPSVLVILTGFLYAITASLGAWTGNNLRKAMQHVAAN